MQYEFELERGDLKIVTVDADDPGWLRVTVEIGSDEGVALYSSQTRVAVSNDSYRVEVEEAGLTVRVAGGLLAGRSYAF